METGEHDLDDTSQPDDVGDECEEGEAGEGEDAGKDDFEENEDKKGTYKDQKLTTQNYTAVYL